MLTEIDPTNQVRYEQNLANFIVKLDALDARIKAKMINLKDKNFIVVHNAYNYFINCYGLNNFSDNEYIYSQNNKKDIYEYINKLWKERSNYHIVPGGNNTFKDSVGGWLNHFLYNFLT